MLINSKTAEQFLDALNDRLSNGDWAIDAIAEEEAGNMCRQEMDDFLCLLMLKVLEDRGEV